MNDMKFTVTRKYTDIGHYNEARQDERYVEAYQKELEEEKKREKASKEKDEREM